MTRSTLLFSSILVGLTPFGALAWNLSPLCDEGETPAPVQEHAQEHARKAAGEYDRLLQELTATQGEVAEAGADDARHEAAELRAQVQALRAEKQALEQAVHRERERTREPRRARHADELAVQEERIVRDFEAQRGALRAQLEGLRAVKEHDRQALASEMDARRRALHELMEHAAGRRQQEMQELERGHRRVLLRLHEELGGLDPRQADALEEKQRELDRAAEELARSAEALARQHDERVEALARQLEQTELERSRRVEHGTLEFDRHIEELGRELEQRNIAVERALMDLQNRRELHVLERHREFEEVERAMELRQEELEGRLERESEEFELQFERAAEEFERMAEELAEEQAFDAEDLARQFEHAAEGWEVELDLWADELDGDWESAIDAWTEAVEELEDPDELEGERWLKWQVGGDGAMSQNVDEWVFSICEGSEEADEPQGERRTLWFTDAGERRCPEALEHGREHTERVIQIDIHDGPVYIDATGGSSRTLIRAPRMESPPHAPCAPGAPHVAPTPFDRNAPESCDEGVVRIPLLPAIEGITVQRVALQQTPPERVVDLRVARPALPATPAPPTAVRAHVARSGLFPGSIAETAPEPLAAPTLRVRAESPDQDAMLAELNALVREMLGEVKDLRKAIEELREDVGEKRTSRGAGHIGRSPGGGAASRLR